jgi:hypothetical protein
MRAILPLLVAGLLAGCSLAISRPDVAPVAPGATPTVGDVSRLAATPQVSAAAAKVLASPPVLTQTQTPSTPNASAPSVAINSGIQDIPPAPTPTVDTSIQGSPTTPTPTVIPRTVTLILDRTVNLRGGPTIDAEIIAVLEPGTAVRTADVDGITTGDPTHWVPATYDNRYGYIRADLLSSANAKSGQGK